MKKLLFAFTLCQISLLFTFAQKPSVSFHSQPVKMFPKVATTAMFQNEPGYQAGIQNLEAPVAGGPTYREFLLRRKAENPERVLELPIVENRSGRMADQPITLRNFEGNFGGSGVPNDNNMAISNEGKLISVINSTIWIYDVVADTLLKMQGLQGLMAPLGLNLQTKYDPKVIYDPQADKFIVVCLNGSSSGTSRICVAFSESNNPLGNWNFYALPGNPIIDTTWSDYPMIALTDGELFLTINSLRNNLSWQEAFVETLIWQIDKNDGYNGDSLATKIWNDIEWNGKPVRNVCPVRGGNRLYGPNLYFLSNRNFALQNDTVFLIEITGDLQDVSATLNMNVVKTQIPFGLAPAARQENGHEFDTNDSRVLSAYFQDGEINYVQNTIGPDSGFCSVYHGIISNPFAGNLHEGHIITDAVRDFGYPNLSYTGKYDGDRECIINFNHTAPTVWSGCSAVFYNNGSYSNPMEIKAGENYADILSGTYERWGDYSGSQPKYNEPGVTWMCGSFGRTNQRNGTWIAELVSPDTASQPPAFVARSFNHLNPAKVFPNPAPEFFELEFEMKQPDFVQISLWEVSGKKVSDLIDQMVKPGTNRFYFSTLPLVSGIYFVKGSTRKGQEIFNRKVVKP